MIYSAVAAVLVLSSCSSAYQTAQTPDDVYHSPARPQTVYASNTASNTRSDVVEETYDDNGDTYVTYQDDEERYDYARRIDNFSRGYRGNYWDGYYYDDFYGSPNVYINNYYGSRWGSWGSYWGPSFGIGLGFGWGYNPYRWGGWYSPWYGYHNPWYSPWYGSGWYGSGWHGGGWGYPVWGGHYSNPRPSNSWGPRGSASSRVFNTGSGNVNTGNRNTSGAAPRRVFDRSGTPTTTPGNGSSAPRRVFDRSSSERPASQPSNSTRRVFQRSSSERPVSQPTYDRSNERRSIPQRSAPVRSEPTYRAPERSSAPARSYPSSSPSNNSGSNSAPARTFRPRGG